MINARDRRLADYQARKESGRCTRRGCVAPAGDTVLCDAHAEEARATKRASQDRKRAERARQGLCAECGAKSKTYRCLACKTRSRSFAFPTTNEHNGARNTPPAAEIDQWRPDPGTNWKRYRGKARRGKPPDALLDDQDLAFAVDELARAKEGLVYARSPEVLAMPRIQRNGVMQAALDRLALAKRWINEILARHKSLKV